MGYTNKKYTEIEIAILTVNYPNHDNERAKEGDIIVVRRPHYIVGKKEMTDYIWMRIEGLEENEYPNLAMLNYDLGIYTGDENIPRFDKRRYCIPLHRLEQIFPSFNINRARDSLDIYQPFMVLDKDTGEYLIPKKPYSISGLVFDKIKGVYL